MQPLGGVRVVELATGVAGPFAGKLFADYGADVVKVEPPGGDPGRHAGPFADDDEDGDVELGALHLFVNGGKRSIVADLATPDGVSLVDRLIAGADVLIESLPPGALDEVGLGPDVLAARRPGLVRMSVTPFGQWGPYAGTKGEEIVAYAMGGPMNATGLPDREPVKLAGNLVQYQCGSIAAVAGLAALTVAVRSGRGVWVDVSNFETQAGSIDRRGAYLMWHVFTGRPVPREGGHRLGLIPAGVYPAADGYVQVLEAPNWMPQFAEMLGDPEVIARMADPEWYDDPDLPELLDVAVHVWTLARGKQQAMIDAQAARQGITAVNTPLDVLADPHLRARNWWTEVDHPRAGRYEVPGPPFRMDDGWRMRRPAPLLDQHGDELRAELAATPAPPPTAAALDRRASTPAALPLEGVRVLDLTVVWAGPYCTMLLGDLGAEVIRLDNPNRYPTATRGAVPRPRPGKAHELGAIWGAFPDLDPGERPWNRVGAFAVHARSKLGATLDLRTELGRETFLRLVERSDVVVENNSAKVLDSLGLGWEVLRHRNPRLVVLRMPSLGLSGPSAGYIGFGAHVEALCGLTALRGYRDLDLTSSGGTYHMDPSSGAGGAFAVLAALRRRERTGRGELIEFAQAENLLQHIGEQLVDASRSGQDRGTLGNRHPTRAPQGCYPAAGDDQWVVLSVGDDEEWAGLRRAMGDPAWAADERFATERGRRTHHDELDRRLADWTVGLAKREVFDRCRAAGVPAGPVLDEADLLADEHLRARGFFRRNGSEDLGEHEYPGHLWHWDGPPLRWGPISRLGVDNEYVYRKVLGLDDAEWQALADEGHLSLDFVDESGHPL
jgi:crotonobetainyl-CoA:carnitine CoA-transferase CaiB-like acyl-CoA transferase